MLNDGPVALYEHALPTMSLPCRLIESLLSCQCCFMLTF